MKAKANANSAANTRDSFISTGEIFADGAMIELVSSSSGLKKPDLLLWNGRKSTVGPRVKHAGCVYEAPELAPTLYRATRLASKCSGYGSAQRLFAGISELSQGHLGLTVSESSLLACFSMSTWLADRLPAAPGLAISGPEEELKIDVLRLLSCVWSTAKTRSGSESPFYCVQGKIQFLRSRLTLFPLHPSDPRSGSAALPHSPTTKVVYSYGKYRVVIAVTDVYTSARLRASAPFGDPGNMGGGCL